MQWKYACALNLQQNTRLEVIELNGMIMATQKSSKELKGTEEQNSVHWRLATAYNEMYARAFPPMCFTPHEESLQEENEHLRSAQPLGLNYCKTPRRRQNKSVVI